MTSEHPPPEDTAHDEPALLVSAERAAQQSQVSCTDAPYADSPPATRALPYPVGDQHTPASGYGIAPGPPGHFVVPRGLIDPVTGEHLSNKSKALAGLLQCLVGWFGAGRFYIGDEKRGGMQLGAFFVGVLLFVVGVDLPVLLGLSAWCIGDAVYIWTGRARDQFGRRLN